MRYDPGLTQAICVSIVGIFMLMVSLIGLAPVVDYFVYTAGSLELTPWGQEMMPHFLIYGSWFYMMIRILAVVFLAYPFIYLFRRHRYREYREDEDAWM